MLLNGYPTPCVISITQEQLTPDSGPLTVGEFGGTRCTLVSASESLDCGRTGALLRHPTVLALCGRAPGGRWSLGVKSASEEVARMVLSALVVPDPVAPSGIRSRIPWSTPALPPDEALEEVTGCGRIGSDRDMYALLSERRPASDALVALCEVDCKSISSASHSRCRRFCFFSDRTRNL